MKTYRHDITRLVPGLALVLMMAVCSQLSLAQSDPVPAAPDSTDNITGTILFIHGRPQPIVPVTVAELRAACVSRLEAAQRGKGHRTADREVMENLVMKWRVRESHLIPEEFLKELRSSHDVSRILVATLLTDNGRFLMTARMIDTDTGRLSQVALEDIDLTIGNPGIPLGGVADWRLIMDDICQSLTPVWTPLLPLADNARLILPMRGISSDPEITSAAAHSLLKTLLDHGVVLLDPAIVEVAMLEEGLPSHWLNARGRRILQKRFSADIVLVTELVSYDSNKSLETANLYDSEYEGPGRRKLSVFSMTMRAVDLKTGTAVRSAQIMHEKKPATGWFGTRIHTTLLQELESTSQELWVAFNPEAKDD